jgi:hypothetical protein
MARTVTATVQRREIEDREEMVAVALLSQGKEIKAKIATLLKKK